jgi:hypothetical protein
MIFNISVPVRGTKSERMWLCVAGASCRQASCAPGEMVLKKDSGLVRDQTYGIRLYTSEELIRLVRAAGFGDVQAHRNFVSDQGDEDLGFMNHRMVVTARKL